VYYPTINDSNSQETQNPPSLFAIPNITMKEDEPLKTLLQDWNVSPKPHPGFRPGVWERIAAESARSRSGTWAAISQWFLVSLPKPIYACAFVILFAMGGLAVADLHAARVTQRHSARMEQRYLTSIDPLAMANNALNPRP
jgi:hypothetical protein